MLGTWSGPFAALVGAALGAGAGDVAEGVGAFVAEGARVGRAAAADRVHDEEEGARHQAIRPRISGRSGGRRLGDRVGGAHPRLGGGEACGVGGVDAGERRVGLDRGAEAEQQLEADRVVDRVAGAPAAAAELDDRERRARGCRWRRRSPRRRPPRRRSRARPADAPRSRRGSPSARRAPRPCGRSARPPRPDAKASRTWAAPAAGSSARPAAARSSPPSATVTS